MKKTLSVIAVQVVLYLIQFIILPLSLPDYYPESNEASIFFLVSALIFTVSGMLIVSKDIVRWLIADAVYTVMIIIYSAKGAYGIGMTGLFEASQYDRSERLPGIIILLGFIVIIQLLSAVVIRKGN